MIYYKHYKLYLEVNMLRRIVAATMIGALALTSGCAFHNPFAKKAEPVTYEAVVQSELSPEER